MSALFFKRLAGALLVPLVLAGCAAEPTAAPVDETFYANIAKGGALDPQKAAEMISDYRVGKGLPAVTLDPGLMKVAESQARAMASADKLSHNIGGRGLTARLKAQGFNGLKAAENVGAGYHTLAETFSGWRDSPSHNKNMLLSGANRIGIAAVRAPKSKYSVYWALVIAQSDPRADAAAGGTTVAAAPTGPAMGETQVFFGGMQLPGQ